LLCANETKRLEWQQICDPSKYLTRYLGTGDPGTAFPNLDFVEQTHERPENRRKRANVSINIQFSA
jgi:hypothetical protein